MRHAKAGFKLGRTSSHRKAMFRNMITSLLVHEKIKTTDVKAKELKRLADKMVTLGKRGDLHARRRALTYVRSKAAVKKLFEEISPRFLNRSGGYTRVVKLGYRHGDNAPLALVEFVVEGEKKEKKKKKVEKKAEG
ncbi:MAG TPA: 50S ribosomal protein L17 [Syntrophales bacterium]|nr:50S ribosomal protein L17 [Syntrophales bacterium]HOL58865.1 50S ribosomal protein L17 [Syntrophales bacterium]HPO35192.1 50S ribosomal protein L17 [Syntrophales bacterium]